MKHFYATLIFCSMFVGNAFAQCSALYSSYSYGNGNYYFYSLNLPSEDIVGTFVLTGGADTLSVDSNTLNTSFRFDTNGTYQLCVFLHDTFVQCDWDTCLEIIVDDAEYQPMLREVNHWRLNIGSCPVLASPGDPASRSECQYYDYAPEVFANLDTLINGVAYKIVQLALGSYGSSLCEWGLIREDTLERKVFARRMDSLSERLLYDFSLRLKDTIMLDFEGQSGYYKKGVYRVDSIRTLELYPERRRVFFLNPIYSPGSSTMVWIQGIGHLGTPTYLFSPNEFSPCHAGNCNSSPYSSIIPMNYISSVSCFYHNEVAYFDSCTYNDVLRNENSGWIYIEDSCRYYLYGAIHETGSLKSLNISPNPTDGLITLQLDIKESSEFEIILHAMDGRTVSGNYNLGRLSAGLQSRSLNLSNLSSGFYLLECRNKEGSVFKKLVINR